MDKFKPEDDKKFYLEIPDPDFSPARNAAIVQGTIKKYNKTQLEKKREHVDKYGERIDAIVSYLKTTEKKPGYDMLRYFEPKYLAFLRGDDIRRELLMRSKLIDNEGNELIINI